MKRLTTEDFIKKAREVHGDKFDYRYVNYVNNKTKVSIICPLHGRIYQTPDNHLRFNCYSCRMREQLGTKKDIPSNLYYISFKVNGRTYYKLGITYLDVATRYKNQPFQDFKILAVVRYDKGIDAFDKEQLILNTYDEYRRAIPKEVYGDGWTETMSYNIFETEDEQEIINKIVNFKR